MTTTTEWEAAEVYKRDKMGRVRVSRERREELLDEYERGGSSGAQFASYVEIKYTTLANWIQSRRKERRQQKALAKAKEKAPCVTLTEQ